MNTLTIAPLIIPALVVSILVVLLIKEQGHLYKNWIYNKFLKNSSEKANISGEGDTKTQPQNSYIDFSGGAWGI